VRVYKALSIAGSDPSGGAGIQADLKAFSALGVFGTTAVTAVVDENTVGVTGVHPVPIEFVSGQIHSVLSDVGADAIKIGMLHSSELIRAVKDAISEYRISNIVLDPVMVATSGDKLLQDEAIGTLKSELIPFVRLITPNIPEAEILSGQKIDGQADLPDLAKSLSEQFGGKVSVLLKAGHLEDDELVDVFYNAEEGGTGCTLSSAVAAFLAKGFGLDEAITQAQAYLHQAIVAGADFPIGKGRGPVHHFWNVPGWGEGAKE